MHAGAVLGLLLRVNGRARRTYRSTGCRALARSGPPVSTMEAVLDSQSELVAAVDRPPASQRRRISQRIRRSREEQAVQTISEPQQARSRRRRDAETVLPSLHDSLSRQRGSTMYRVLGVSQELEGVVNYTKTGRISKAKKGIKDYHHCKCGKVSMRPSSSIGASLVPFESMSASLLSVGFSFSCSSRIHLSKSKPVTRLLQTSSWMLDTISTESLTTTPDIFSG